MKLMGQLYRLKLSLLASKLRLTYYTLKLQWLKKLERF
jgi:hypothetical protein